MTSSTPLKIFAAAVLLSAVGAVAAVAAAGDATLKEVSGYRRWARVTPEPFRIEYDGPLS